MPQTKGKDPTNINRNWLGEVRTAYSKFGVPAGTPYVPPWFKHYYLQIERDFEDGASEDMKELITEKLIEAVAEEKSCSREEAEDIVIDVKVNKPLILDAIIKDTAKELYRKKTQPIFMSGELFNVSRTVLTPQDFAMYTKGTTKKRKNYYASWDGKYSLMTMSVYEAPFIRFEGQPGGGKSSAMTMLMEESAWRFGAWIRSNIPIPSKRLYGRQINSKVIADLGDLFIDDPPGTSVLWAPVYGIWIIVGVDEHGMALEGYTKSQINSLYEELFWLRRHLKVIFYSTGVSSLPPGIEQYVTKKIVCESKNYGERKHFDAKREFRWKVQKHGDSTDKVHEEQIVYKIPAPEIEPEWGNENEMAGPMGMGISIKNLLQSIDTSAPSEQMAAEADFYVRFWRNPPPMEEGMRNDEYAAYLKAAFSTGIEELRRRFRSVRKPSTKELSNSQGYAIRIFYECKDCGNRWLFKGGGKPHCSACNSYAVRSLSLSDHTAEEFNIVELARGKK